MSETLSPLAGTPCSALSRSDANSKAWLMAYEDRAPLLEKHGWRNLGHWDHWEDPRNRWTYDTHGALVSLFMYPDWYPQIGP